MKLKILILLLFIAYSNSFSQFGKNKVQYERFDWKYIETEHFDVYFHEGGYYLANYTAIEAEKALIKIEDVLNYKLSHRISMVVFNTHNQFQQNNIINSFLSEGTGGVTQLFKNNIVLPFQGSYSQLHHVICHELTHGVLNDMFHGGSLQTAISLNTFSIPLWMNEGLAEYISLDGMDVDNDQYMRDIVVSEELEPLERTSGYMSYRAGQTFYWYIADKYGKEKIGELLNRLKIEKRLDYGFLYTFNMSLEDFSEKWQKEVKKYYLPDVEMFKDLDDIAQRITNRKKLNNFYNSAPAISPDGQKMAYITEQNGSLFIGVCPIDKPKEVRNIVESFRKQDFEDLNMLAPGISWNPKGDKLAISAKAGGEDAIFITNASNGDYEKLKFGIKSIESVQWSPDGKKLAFVGSINEASDIFIYEFATKKLINLTKDIFSDKVPVWSPDSKSIYFVSDRKNNIKGDFNKTNFRFWNEDPRAADIYEINVETKEIKRLTTDSQNNKTSLSVSSDNSKLIFVSDKNGINNLYILDKNDLSQRPITNSLSSIRQISFARDDSKLLLSAQTDGGYDIYQIKMPLNIKLDSAILPLTKLKKINFDRQNLTNKLANSTIDSSKNDNVGQLQGYGDFNISFNNQKMVEPNPDAEQRVSISNSNIKDTLFTPKDYKLKFSPDYVAANPGYSSFWGIMGVAQALYSDEMGDHQIYASANLLVDFKNSNFALNYSYLPEVIDYHFGLYQNAGWVFDGSDGNTYRYRDYGINLMASYPFSLFTRLEFGLSWKIFSKTNISEVGANDKLNMVLAPELKYVYDDVLWGRLGPNRGTRFFLKLQGSPSLGSEIGHEFATFNFDARNYNTFFKYLTLAIRGSGGVSLGKNPNRFFLGGTDLWFNRTFGGNGSFPFSSPADFAFFQIETPLRGASINQINGTKYFLVNTELRFPIFAALMTGPVPIFIQGVMGNIFFDAGGAWDNKFNSIAPDPFTGELVYNNLVLSTGVGLRFNLFGFPFKVDVAWRKLVGGWTDPMYMYSLGYDF